MDQIVAFVVDHETRKKFSEGFLEECLMAFANVLATQPMSDTETLVVLGSPNTIGGLSSLLAAISCLKYVKAVDPIWQRAGSLGGLTEATTRLVDVVKALKEYAPPPSVPMLQRSSGLWRHAEEFRDRILIARKISHFIQELHRP